MSIGARDFMNDLCVEFVCMWVSEGRRVGSVSFDDESFGDFSEVGSHLKDVTLGGGFGVLHMS